VQVSLVDARCFLAARLGPPVRLGCLCTHAPPAVACCMVHVLAGDDAHNAVLGVNHNQVAQAKQHKRLQEVQQRRHGQQQTHTGACRRLIGLKKSACKMLGSPSAQQQPPCTWAHIVNSKAPAIHRLETGGLATGSNAPTSTQLPWLLQTRHAGFLGLVEAYLTHQEHKQQASGSR